MFNIIRKRKFLSLIRNWKKAIELGTQKNWQSGLEELSKTIREIIVIGNWIFGKQANWIIDEVRQNEKYKRIQSIDKLKDKIKQQLVFEEASEFLAETMEIWSIALSAVGMPTDQPKRAWNVRLPGRIGLGIG